MGHQTCALPYTSPCEPNYASVTPLYVAAEIKQSSPSSTPSTSNLKIKVVHKFDTACQCYFSVNDVPADDHVAKIIYNFESTAIQPWINAEEV